MWRVTSAQASRYDPDVTNPGKLQARTATALSGKGGTAKTTWQMMMAGEASRVGLRVLLIDFDPERNLSYHFGVKAHATGIGNALEDAGVTSGEGDAEKGAKRLGTEIIQTHWDSVDLVPAGATLQGISQVAIEDTWLLRDIMAAAQLPERYDVILIDTGGRTGSLVTLAMYASDVAYAPIAPTGDAVRKAIEARARVERIQRAHPLEWAGVVLSGFSRTAIEDAIRSEVLETFGEYVRAEVPRRTVINEAFQLNDRLGDDSRVPSQELAKIFLSFLMRDILRRPNQPSGVLR